MSCEWFEENLARYIHLDMEEDELLKADEHLSTCEKCGNIYGDALNASMLISKHLQNETEISLPKEKRENILAAVKPKIVVVKKSKINLTTFIASVAAVLMAVLGLVILLGALIMPKRSSDAVLVYRNGSSLNPPDYRSSEQGSRLYGQGVQNLNDSDGKIANDDFKKSDVKNVAKSDRSKIFKKIFKAQHENSLVEGVGVSDDFNSDGEFNQDVVKLKEFKPENVEQGVRASELDDTIVSLNKDLKGGEGQHLREHDAVLEVATAEGIDEKINDLEADSVNGKKIQMPEEDSRYRPAKNAPPSPPKASSETDRSGRPSYYEGGYLAKKSDVRELKHRERMKETKSSSQDESLSDFDDLAGVYSATDRPTKNKAGKDAVPILGDIPVKGELYKRKNEPSIMNDLPVTGAGFLSDVHKLDGNELAPHSSKPISDVDLNTDIYLDSDHPQGSGGNVKPIEEMELYDKRGSLAIAGEVDLNDLSNFDFGSDQTDTNKQAEQKKKIVKNEVNKSKFSDQEAEALRILEKDANKELARQESTSNNPTKQKNESWSFKNHDEAIFDMLEKQNERELVTDELVGQGGGVATKSPLYNQGVDDDNDGAVRDKKSYDSEDVKERVQNLIAGEALDSQEGTSVEVFQGKHTIVNNEQKDGVDGDFVEEIVEREETVAVEVEKKEEMQDSGVNGIQEVVTYNPFTITSQDALSTFSIDTDTASFDLAQKYLNQNKIPRPSTVRVEEFINSMDYQYPVSPQKDFSVYTELMTSPYRKNIQLLKVAVKAKVLGRDQVKPNHIIFVVDASGSMSRKDRMPLVQKGVFGMLDHLQPNDRISLISFGTGAQIFLQNCSVTDKDSIRSALASLQTGGSTNLLAGLKKGYDVALNHLDSKTMNRLVICSDGVTNVGEQDAKVIIDSVVSLRKQGISCTTIGFGAGDYNDHLMESIANKGDGFYLYINSEKDLHRVFSQQFVANLEVVGRDVKIQVSFDPSKVYRYRLLGYENRNIADQDFRNDKVDAGEISSGKTVTALYELELLPYSVNNRLEDQIGKVFVRYKLDDSNYANEIAQNINADSFLEREPSPYFKLAACIAEFAEILRESPYVKETKTSDLLLMMESIENQLPRDQQITVVKNMIMQFNQLSGR